MITLQLLLDIEEQLSAWEQNSSKNWIGQYGLKELGRTRYVLDSLKEEIESIKQIRSIEIKK